MEGKNKTTKKKRKKPNESL